MLEFDGSWKRYNTQLGLYVGQRDSVTAGFPRGKQPNFPMGESPLGQYSCIHHLIANCIIQLKIYECMKTVMMPSVVYKFV